MLVQIWCELYSDVLHSVNIAIKLTIVSAVTLKMLRLLLLVVACVASVKHRPTLNTFTDGFIFYWAAGSMSVSDLQSRVFACSFSVMGLFPFLTKVFLGFFKPGTMFNNGWRGGNGPPHLFIKIDLYTNLC